MQRWARRVFRPTTECLEPSSYNPHATVPAELNSGSVPMTEASTSTEDDRGMSCRYRAERWVSDAAREACWATAGRPTHGSGELFRAQHSVVAKHGDNKNASAEQQQGFLQQDVIQTRPMQRHAPYLQHAVLPQVEGKGGRAEPHKELALGEHQEVQQRLLLRIQLCAGSGGTRGSAACPWAK